VIERCFARRQGEMDHHDAIVFQHDVVERFLFDWNGRWLAHKRTGQRYEEQRQNVSLQEIP